MGSPHFIVKVQRSLYTTEDQAQVLIYDRSRIHQCEMPLSEYPGPRMKLGQFKLYLWAQLRDGALVLGQRAPDQDW